MSSSLFQKESMSILGMLVLVNIIGIFTDKIPLQFNITLQSVLIISLGAFKSVEELLKQMKRIHIDKLGGSDSVEKMSFSDAWQFPIMAGVTLCSMYFAMEYFGKEAVNYFVLFYIACGGSQGIKALINAISPGSFDHMDKENVVDINIKLIGLELQMSIFDFICLFISYIAMGFYVWSESFIFNNLLATIFTLHALQSTFISNFKNGFLLLILLFFYDIFFVFGTDVMLTVAKGIKGPIKIQFPRDYSGEKPEYGILGLGDLVIPGVVVTLALRFDILKSIDVEKLSNMFVKEQEGGDVNTMQFLMKKASTCKKTYFTAILLGYFFAIIATIVVMFVFDHGQPALLYLVPGCILSLVLTSMYQGEFSTLWNFDEDPYITAPGEDSDEDEDDKKDSKKDK